MTHDFETVRRTARRLGRSFRLLEPVLDEEEDRRVWVRHRRRCLGIAEAMGVTADAPAAITPALLAAFDRHLEEAHRDLSDWCDRLLNPDAEPDAVTLTEDELPY